MSDCERENLFGEGLKSEKRKRLLQEQKQQQQQPRSTGGAHGIKRERDGLYFFLSFDSSCFRNVEAAKPKQEFLVLLYPSTLLLW